MSALAAQAFAGDIAILHNGFNMRHDHHEVMGDNTRLYMDENGKTFVDVPTAEIDRFEKIKEDTEVPLHNQMEPDPEVVAPPPAPVQPAMTAEQSDPSKSNDLHTVVRNASSKVKLDPDLIHSVIRYESGGNAHAVSSKGALGLMQLMPQTAKKLGVRNAFNPEQNVQAGTQYLRALLEQFNFDLVKALAAYNAGPESVLKYGGVPPYLETRQYVASIVKDFNKKKLAQKSQLVAQKPAN